MKRDFTDKVRLRMNLKNRWGLNSQHRNQRNFQLSQERSGIIFGGQERVWDKGFVLGIREYTVSKVLEVAYKALECPAKTFKLFSVVLMCYRRIYFTVR